MCQDPNHSLTYDRTHDPRRGHMAEPTTRVREPVPRQRAILSSVGCHADTTLAVAFGGALGALARYAISVVSPHDPGGFPWSTFAANVSGCLAIGVLMVLIVDVWPAHRLVRPFLGVGVLGGFTTFSTYAMESRALLEDGSALIGVAYLAGTLLAALVAVWLGARLTRRVAGVGRRRPTSLSEPSSCEDGET